MDTTQLPPHSKEFLRLLTSHKIEYLLVGGYAVGFYGFPRATIDIDVWIERSEENARSIVAMLEEFGFADAGLNAEWFLQENKNFRMGVPPNRIELLTGISGVEFSECRDRGIPAEIDGVPVVVIGLDDLKTNKAASGRHKDLEDLRNLP